MQGRALTEDEFDSVKSLQKYGLKDTPIANITKLSFATVKRVKHADTYQQFIEFRRAEKAQTAANKVAKAQVAAAKKVAEDLDKAVLDGIFDNLDTEDVVDNKDTLTQSQADEIIRYMKNNAEMLERIEKAVTWIAENIEIPPQRRFFRKQN